VGNRAALARDHAIERRTVVKVAHLTELRTALAAVYTKDGVTQPTYTNPIITAGSTISALDITQLRAAIVDRE